MGINALFHSGTCLDFGVRLGCPELITGACYDLDLNPGSYGCELSALPLNFPAISTAYGGVGINQFDN